MQVYQTRSLNRGSAVVAVVAPGDHHQDLASAGAQAEEAVVRLPCQVGAGAVRVLAGWMKAGVEAAVGERWMRVRVEEWVRGRRVPEEVVMAYEAVVGLHSVAMAAEEAAVPHFELEALEG